MPLLFGLDPMSRRERQWQKLIPFFKFPKISWYIRTKSKGDKVEKERE